MYNQKCLPCNKTAHCNTCFGEKNYIVCTSCEPDYILINNTCLLENCIIGENEKCKSCNSEFKNQCQLCNDGYYLPTDGNKEICQKCLIENCDLCSGTFTNQICLKCKDEYINENNKCKKQEIVSTEQVCPEEYFIPEDSNNCQKCSLENCKTCVGMLNNNTCLECKSGYEKTINQNNIIEYCSFPSDIKYNNWIEIVYNITDYNKKSQLMNTLYTYINLNEIEMYINNTYIYLTKDPNPWDKPIYHKFDKNGVYTIKMNIKKNLTSMAWMFTNLHQIVSISFLPGFDASKVTSVSDMFACTSIKSLNLTYLNTNNIRTYNYFMDSSIEITSIDLSSFNITNAYELKAMFFRCQKLAKIDLSSFNTSNVDDCTVLFHDLPENCTIIISNKFTKCREQIPFYNKVINIDELSCNKIEKCIECNGSGETLKCVKCELGYELIDNICKIPKCNLGENDKCLSCQKNPDKEQECLGCNEGYYLPENLNNKNKCSQCSINGCKTCDNNICNECKIFYDPVYDNNNKNIISSCKLRCDIGMKEKCVTCNIEKGKESECSSCNEGFRLINGKCKKIENSFIAIYNVTSSKKFTKIMCLSKNGIKLSDIEMYANGKKIIPIIDEMDYGSWTGDKNIGYVFPQIGIVEIKVIFNKTLTSMEYLFADCDALISIEFHETFDTSHVLCMRYTFGSCDNMKYINVSSFNTSIVGDMEGMFCNCAELTSLDLSNFITRNVYHMQCIFAYSDKLSFLDISSFDTTYLAGSSWMLDDLAEDGTIIIGKNYKLNNIPEKWKIIRKE